jgi:osmotically inducible lipoprotein OsmB
MKKLSILILSLMLLSGCDHLSRQEQRALSGGAIGAAGGVALTAVTGGSLLVGGLVGGAAGSAIGALTR